MRSLFLWAWSDIGMDDCSPLTGFVTCGVVRLVLSELAEPTRTSPVLPWHHTNQISRDAKLGTISGELKCFSVTSDQE